MLKSTRIKLIFFISIPLVLFLIPINWLSDSHTLCLYKNYFNKECYGCGITRAVFSILHLKFEKALAYNKLVLIVFPLLVFAWVKRLKNIYNKTE